MELLRQTISYHDDARYEELKDSLREWLLPLGEYGTVGFLSGSQAIERAILIAKDSFPCKRMFKMRGAYHGLNVQQWENGETTFRNLDLCFLDIQADGYPDLSGLLLEKNAIILLEPLLLYALYGERASSILQTIQQFATQMHHIVIADEVRSGVFKTGFFLLSERAEGFHPHIVCISKGLSLGVALSVACFREDFIPSSRLKVYDINKSNLTLSALALQRAVDFLHDVQINRNAYFDEIKKLESMMEQELAIYFSNRTYMSAYLAGATCVFRFDVDTRASKLRAVRMALLSSGLIVRHFEDHLLYLNFPVDIDIEQVQIAFHIISNVLDYLF
jgi:4-aminobutyrate aminotransferase-like enzyme